MGRYWWPEPVRVAIGGSTAINVNSNEKAAELLLYDWPDASSARHRRARETVLRSMEHPGDPGGLYAARQAFVAAADEAHILLPEPPRSIAPKGFKTPKWRRRKS